ncbi:polyneuridine-aldehyde esterase-like [Magnolia sinica]|uniref:polyneuridine-aldehyde esterase-like n=1 Tax=Magnolia sinica TaxID=86752 RepID=UPI002657FFFF|nr:polyneuridine-aldehyde esterase-like [Magnolia sinica]
MTAESNEHFILVHGGCHGAWSWHKLSTLLTSAGHQVTAINLAACGVHPKQINEIGSFHDYTQPLMDLMTSLPPHKRVILVGHNFGGVVLSLAMERFPEKISVAFFATAMMLSLASPPSIIVKEDETCKDEYLPSEKKQKEPSQEQISECRMKMRLECTHNPVNREVERWGEWCGAVVVAESGKVMTEKGR